MAKRDTRFKPGISGNQTAKWKPGHSGNPAGKSKRRLEFEELFNEALLAHGGPEEAAKLLWEAARRNEPWAIQELCRRYAPPTPTVHLVHEVSDDQFDYSKLTDDQIQRLEAIMDEASTQSPSAES
jgi:hypothetical protein